jgi:hypothetical protein
MSNIIPLNTAPVPRYQIGQTFQLRRNAWSRELITATVETSRVSTVGVVYTLAIDTGRKYPHWRVVFESLLSKQIVEPAAIAA